MKSIIYKNPVISGVIFNLAAMFLSIYAIKYRVSILIFLIIPVGSLNRKIMDNGVGMDKKKKAIIMISFVIMIATMLIYNWYVYDMINKQLENM